MKPAQHPLQGIALLLLAVACFAVLDSTVKHLSLSLPVLLAVWFRYLFQALAMSAVVLPTRGWRSLRTEHPRLHLLRGILLLVVSTLAFFSLSLMPVGEFTAIIMLTPMVTTLLARLFLKESVSLLRWLLVGGGFIGALLVAQPGGATPGWGVLLALCTTLMNSCYQVLTSRLARTEDALTLNFYTGWVGALSLSAALPLFWQPLQGLELLGLLCLVGLSGTVGHFLFGAAFGRAPAATLAPYLYAQIGFAMLAGWLVFGHVPGPVELAGIALIACCGSLAAWIAARVPRPA
jgi:drug/metabolite transporter (DMT)-like permease